ncbi:hypothetical protein ALC57_17589 [Trachymyrmex cornetzi]|uniref:Transmembrane protein 138 n=1 Tax=Trachymyrmex cornetzi TaxID=471704 RepID=A0A151ITU5_9HYME|nr:hypothetical protein ALC57_17589 [Trachymyrmex cornetzi]
MGSLNTRQYMVIVILQYVILLFDVCINSFASFARQHPTDLLVLYVIQDFCLIIALTLLLVNFFSTYIFQRTVAVLYYYFYKRASLRIGDPRFYKSSAWVQKQLSIP